MPTQSRSFSASGSVSPAVRITRALGVLVAVVLIGTLGFTIIEGWDVWRALFFTLITITTVGYSADGLTTAGERFTTFLLIGGIGTAGYAFGAVIQTAVDSQLAWRRRMQKKIDKLRDHHIICGFGNIGRVVGEQLAAASLPFVIIESNDKIYEDAVDRGYLAVQGGATEDENLVLAGIERAAGIVCAVNADSDNIVIALGAREMRPDIRIIARVEDEGSTRKIRRAGASQVISPSRTGALDIADTIIHPHTSEFLHSAEDANRFELGDVVIAPESAIAGRSIRELGGGDLDEIVFVAIKRLGGATRIRPGGDTRLQGGDVLIVAGKPANLAWLARQAGQVPAQAA